MLKLYGYGPSGNSYKVELLLAQLEMPFDWVEMALKNGETRTPEFLALNPVGKIPLIVLEDGRRLAESHAILWYFGEGTRFVPEDRFARAEMWQWLCYEQYYFEPTLAVVRHRLSVEPSPSGPLKTLIDEKTEQGYRMLEMLNRHLSERTFIVAEQYTLADIALFAYTHVAHEGRFDMSPYPAIHRWFERVRRQPRFRPMRAGLGGS